MQFFMPTCFEVPLEYSKPCNSGSLGEGERGFGLIRGKLKRPHLFYCSISYCSGCLGSCKRPRLRDHRWDIRCQLRLERAARRGEEDSLKTKVFFLPQRGGRGSGTGRGLNSGGSTREVGTSLRGADCTSRLPAVSPRAYTA